MNPFCDIQQIAFSLYELHHLTGGGGRQGALLRFCFDNGQAGYADCHPWPELGDPALIEQLQLLQQKKLTQLTARSFFFAEKDARARFFGAYLFADQTIPASHWLIDQTTLLPEASHLKIKVGHHKLNEELAFLRGLPAHYRLRLDANGRLTPEEFIIFAEELEGRIDFFEDPVPFDPSIWKSLKRCGVPLALDRRADCWAEEDACFDYLIFKPAIQPLVSTPCPIVITSYLDHPLGQLCAAYTAATAGCQLSICGLLSHTAYQPNDFSARLQINGDRLIPPKEGTGFGFDDLLEKTIWHPLV